MAALVAALLIQASDRTPWTAASLGDRHAAKGAVIAATVLALALGNAFGVVGGVLVAPLLSPNARDLMLALALFSGGIAAFWPHGPARLREGRFGPFGSSLGAVVRLGFGDRMPFVTAALAARSDTPALAAIGATIGASAVVVPAILLGERAVRRLPTTAVRLVAAAILAASGALQGLAALRLI